MEWTPSARRDRMPVIIAVDDEPRWLEPKGDVQDLLKPFNPKAIKIESA